MFEDPSPYRRKSSLVASDSIPPHLRREPPAHNNKTECLVHQFLANQRKPEHRLPTRHHQQHQPREQDEHHEHHRHRLHDITRAHHKQTVTASPEAADLSSPEAKLDRSQAPDLDKDKHNEAAKKEGKEQQPATQPCATVLPDDSCTTTTSSEEAASSSNPPSFRPRRHHGQSDEKQWRREMIGPTPTTPDTAYPRRMSNVPARRQASQPHRRRHSQPVPPPQVGVAREFCREAGGYLREVTVLLVQKMTRGLKKRREALRVERERRENEEAGWV